MITETKPKKLVKEEESILNIQRPLVTRQIRKRYRGQGKMKLKRIDKYGCRGQIPVDMSEDFYNNGNEYCRYLITDYRASLLRKK